MEAWLTPQAVAGILVPIAAIIGAIWTIMRERRREPVERRTADAAVAASQATANEVVVKSFSLLVSDHRQEIDRLNKENDELEAKISKVGRWVYLWESWHTELRLKWNTVRAKTAPPAAPDYEKETWQL